MSPASRVCSARSRLTTTITAHVSIHDSQPCLPHPVPAEVGWCCTGPTLAMCRNEPADEASALQPADDLRPNQAVDQCSRLRRRGDDADEQSNGTPVVR